MEQRPEWLQKDISGPPGLNFDECEAMHEVY